MERKKKRLTMNKEGNIFKLKHRQFKTKNHPFWEKRRSATVPLFYLPGSWASFLPFDMTVQEKMGVNSPRGHAVRTLCVKKLPTRPCLSREKSSESWRSFTGAGRLRKKGERNSGGIFLTSSEPSGVRLPFGPNCPGRERGGGRAFSRP